MARGVAVAAPVSHLFHDPESARRITAASDLLELRHQSQAQDAPGQVLFHCDLSLVAPWDDVATHELSSVANGLARGGGRLEAVSFHLASQYRDNDIRDGAFVGRGTPMDAQGMLSTAVRNAEITRRIFPGVPLMVENNNHLGTSAYDVVTDGAFITNVTGAADAGLLLDVAHARITAANTGRREDDYFSALPLEKVWQVHLSRHGRCNDRATDAHDALADEDWEYFTALSMRTPRLRYATIEYYKDVDVLLAQTVRLRAELAWRNS